MTFIAILVALIIERFFHWSHLRHWNWFLRYQHFLSVRMGTKANVLIFLAAVLPPVLVFGFVSWLLTGWFYNLFKIIFSVIVLIYCLGPQNLWLQIYNCIRIFKENPADALEQIKTDFGVTQVEQPQAFHQAFTRAIFIAANERIFAVVFWFIVLGPAGAVLYRAVNLCAVNTSLGVMSLAAQVQRYLNWIPIRIFTFIFALGGHYTRVISRWKTYAKDGVQSNDAMLGECGIAALSVEQEQKLPEDGSAETESIALLDRVLVMGLVIIAFCVLILR